MTCDETRLLLHAYLDDELDAAQSASLLAHLGACNACAARYADHAQLRTALAQPALDRRAPDALRARWRATAPVAAPDAARAASHDCALNGVSAVSQPPPRSA